MDENRVKIEDTERPAVRGEATAAEPARPAEVGGQGPDRHHVTLEQSEERYRALVDSATDAIVSADVNGRIVSWNRAAERMFGYSRDQILHKPLATLMPESYRDQHERGLRRFLVSGEARAIGRTVELEGLRHDSSTFPVELALSTWTTSEGRFFTGVMRDITDRRRTQDELAHRALHDPLTGLPNRTLVVDRIGQALARSARHDWSVAVLFFDVDRFKVVNDSLGHSAGDALLVLIVDRLRALLRPGDTMARLGGDEFLVVCEEVDGLAQARHLAERLSHAFKAPFSLGEREMFATASTGIAVGRGPDATPESLLRDADAAMYRAKERGRARYEVFDEDMRAQLLRRLDTEHAMPRALERGEFRIHYQPIVSLDSGTMTGVEALVRWEHPEHGLISPAEFVPIAEDNGLIVPLGAWVLRQAIEQAAEWQRQYPSRRDLHVTVNLSARQLQDPGLPFAVANALEEMVMDPSSLTLEITESVLMHDRDISLARLLDLKFLGVRLAIDDFGTGYSS
ncbi:MAG: diguanylate cyclase/phosphodiesterase with and sensor(s), partial [Acidimicrobiales bacterium]|nr:diguanylate cyclase/phosphodiesterase with and sensor(s) [Acidimicrobiales bacterium]